MNTTSLLTAQHGLVINPFAEWTGVFDFHSPQETTLNCSSCATSVSLVSVVHVNLTFVFQGQDLSWVSTLYIHTLWGNKFTNWKSYFQPLLKIKEFLQSILDCWTNCFREAGSCCLNVCSVFSLWIIHPFFLFCIEILEFSVSETERQRLMKESLTEKMICGLLMCCK